MCRARRHRLKNFDTAVPSIARAGYGVPFGAAANPIQPKRIGHNEIGAVAHSSGGYGDLRVREAQ